MNTQVEINKIGTTTLATAGKYCDRNIDVNVDLPTYEEELVAEKEKLARILARTIVEYTDDTTTELGWYALRYCQQMTKAEFTKLTNIKSGAFQNCKALGALILRSNAVVTLGNTDAFNSSLIVSGAGYVYVPDHLVDSYKTATNWTAYADKIKPISELEG